VNPILSRILILVAVLLALLVSAAVGLVAVEGLSFGDALYFAVVTVSTVGYGDIYPTTIGGRIIAVLLILCGIGIFLAVMANITEMLLHVRQERRRRQRLDMLIGLFFSEAGVWLLRFFSAVDPDMERVRQDLLVSQGWSDNDFVVLREKLYQHSYAVDSSRLDIEALRIFFREKGELLLRLLENPSLIEQEAFTELLRAVLHLKEEVLARPEGVNLPEPDMAHLANDSKRAYTLLGRQWVQYMRYLKAGYPYLFSLALRTNPFNINATPIVT